MWIESLFDPCCASIQFRLINRTLKHAHDCLRQQSRFGRIDAIDDFCQPLCVAIVSGDEWDFQCDSLRNGHASSVRAGGGEDDVGDAGEGGWGEIGVLVGE